MWNERHSHGTEERRIIKKSRMKKEGMLSWNRPEGQGKGRRERVRKERDVSRRVNTNTKRYCACKSKKTHEREVEK